MKKPIISIIVPTLNSEKTLTLCLQAIKDQTYPQDKIEVLVIDGGSTDNTRQIAKTFGAKVIDNPKVAPEHAISLGLQQAVGKYAVLLGSDEVILSRTSLADKVQMLQKNPKCKNVTTTGLLTPKGFSFVTEYINRFGEPFSHFVYDLDGGNYYQSLIGRYKTSKATEKYVVLKFHKGELTPIVDGGGHFFDLQYLRQITDVKDPGLPGKIFSLMVSNTHQLGVLNNDFINHYSTGSIKGYFKKIRFRIISNLTASKENVPGYRNREQYLKGPVKYKKIFFLPYAFTLLFPVLDSIKMSIQARNYRYLLHIYFTLYTGLEIIYQFIRIRILGGQHSAGKYG